MGCDDPHAERDTQRHVRAAENIWFMVCDIDILSGVFGAYIDWHFGRDQAMELLGSPMVVFKPN